MKHPALEIILASSSPRRKFLLESLGIIPHIVPSHFDEDSILFQGSPAQYVIELAENKAAVIRKEFPKSFVLAADTTVYHAGRVINKPQSLEEAVEIISSLSGSTHTVYTGVALAKDGIIRTEVAETSVRFFPLSREHIEAYVRSQPVLDKAGGYAIQGAGSLLVERIDGCYYNVMGLPLSTVGKLLETFGGQHLGVCVRYLTLFLLHSTLVSAPISSNRCHYLIQKGNLDTVFDIIGSSSEEIPQEVIQQIGETILTSALKSQNTDIQLAALYGASLTNSMGFVQYAELGLKSDSLQTQLASLNLIGSTSHRDSEHLINRALRSNYIPVRLEALWLLSMFHSQTAYTQLEALYAKAPNELRLYLLPLFATEGSTASQDFLSQVCRLSSGELQAGALFALSTLSTQETHPLTTPPFLDPITLEAFLAYAANRRDSVPQETIEEYTKHPNEFIRLAACVLLAQNNIVMLQTVEDLSRLGNPFAVSALGKLPLSDQSPLFGLINHQDDTVRINAGLSLLIHKQPQALSSILEIVLSEKEESCFRPQLSPGGTMTIWAKVPDLSLRPEEKGYIEEQSLRFREAVLAQSLALPEEQFLQIANSVKTCQELLPLLSVLLENKKSEKVREFLKNTYENPPSLFAKLYVAKSLITLNEKGPWNQFALDWLQSEKGLKLFHPRPFLPWFMQPDPKIHDLSIQERSRLSLDLLSALIETNRAQAQKCIISWMKATDPTTRTLLAGLLLQT